MIGIFDSGSGGLTVLKALRDVLPSADVVYFGDIKNAPYGEKMPEQLSRLTVDGFALLRAHGADKIISACNSASTALVLSVFDALNLAPNSIIEMVGPTVSYLKSSDERLVLCATPATIQSGIYQNAFRMVGKDVKAFPIPNLSGAIEFGASEDEMERIIRTSLPPPADFDMFVLACTHYPLVLPLFEKFYPGKIIFDPAIAVAERAYKLFWPQEVRDGTTTFLISKESSQFRSLVKNLFSDFAYTVEVLE